MKKFFSCAIIYLCVTLLTAFGWVYFVRPDDGHPANAETPDEVDQIQPPTETQPESMALTYVLSGLMSTPALQLDFSVTLATAGKQPLDLTGELYLDFSQGMTTPVVQGTLVLQEHALTLLYQDGWVYVTVFGGQYKISTDSVLDVVNVVTSFASASQGDPDQQAQQFTNDLAESVGSGLDLNQIMGALQDLTDEETEDGHAITLRLFDVGIYLNTDVDYQLTQIRTDVLTVNNYQITPFVACTYLDEVREIEVDAADYTDLSALGVWVDAFLNTASLTDWHLTATLKVDLVSLKKQMDIPLDLQIKLVNQKPQIRAILGPIPVIAPIDNDVPYKWGDTVDGLYCGLNRILQVYYADGFVYFYRSEIVPVSSLVGKNRTYEKCWKVTLEEFLADPMMLLTYGCGFTDTIMKEINKAVDLGKNRENPIDPNNVLLGLNLTADELNLLLNLQELANNPQLGSLSLSLFTVQSGDKNYVGRAQLAVDLPLSDAFTMALTCDDLTLVDIGQALDWTAFVDFIQNYAYQTDEQWEASNGNWKMTSSVTYTVNFESNGGPDVEPVTGPVGTVFDVPVLATRIVDDGVTRETYVFIAWYTDPDFTAESRYINGIITRRDLTLYALWDVTVETYRQVVIRNDQLHTEETFTALPGTEFNLATTFANVVVATETERLVYAFDGWYMDEQYQTAWQGGNVVPDYDLTLYAKWVVVSNENVYTVTIVDELWHTQTITLAGFAGDALDLTSFANRYQTVVDDDKETAQKTYTFAGFDQNLTAFPAQDVTIHVVWDCDTKYYYTITFSKDADSRGTLSLLRKEDIYFPVETIRVLEGTTVDLTQYVPTWERRVGIKYYCDFEGWTTVREGTDYVTSVTVTGDMTIYAKWSKQKTSL